MFDQPTNDSKIPQPLNTPPTDLPTTAGADLVSNQPPVKPKLPQTEQVQDIFEQTSQPNIPAKTPELTVKPPTIGPINPLTDLPDDNEMERGGAKKFYWLGIVVLVIVLLGGGYFVYNKFFKKSTITLPEVEQYLNQSNDQPSEPNNPTQPDTQENVEPPVSPAIDSDKDGLTDEEELMYGTEILEPDSDGDGLFDREEVKVYKTNPLLPDTDGDGFLDGNEVKNGYDPNVPGSARLLDLNQQP